MQAKLAIYAYASFNAAVTLGHFMSEHSAVNKLTFQIQNSNLLNNKGQWKVDKTYTKIKRQQSYTYYRVTELQFAAWGHLSPNADCLSEPPQNLLFLPIIC